jgi:hypothetical protein
MVTVQHTPANAVATKLHMTARSTGISDAHFPSESLEWILDQWSDIVFNDFKAQNPEIAEATPDMSRIATIMNQQSQLLIEIQAEVQDL